MRAVTPKMDNPYTVRRAIQRLAGGALDEGSTPKFAGVTLTGLTASLLVGTDSNKTLVSVTEPLVISRGGTGAATLTDHGLLVGSGTDAITPLAAATNGQLPIGSTGVDPVLAAITGTTNRITVTNGAGSITLTTPQDTHTAATPTFGGLTLTGFGGVVKATTGVLAGSAVHADLGSIGANDHHAQIHASAHEVGGGDLVNHDSLTGFVAAEHVSLPAAIAAVLTDHNLAAHTALGLFDASLDVDHDATTNFVADKHIAHTGVSISAGTGMSGGGTIAATRTLDCTITQYTDEMVDDRVSALIQDGTGIAWTYNDVANTLTGNVSITQYTDALARAAISETVTGLDYSSATGVLSLTTGYVIPTTTQETNWGTAYTHSQIAGGDSVHVSTTENTNWDAAYSHIHNLTTDIDHDALTNFASNEHFVQTTITNVSTALSTGLLKVTTGTGALSVITDSSTNWNAAYTHISNVGTDHSYINQDVTTTAGPTFDHAHIGLVDQGYNEKLDVGGHIFVKGTNPTIFVAKDGSNYLAFSYNTTLVQSYLDSYTANNYGILNIRAAGCYVGQSSATAAVPVLKLTQADVSEEFIRFVGTAADGVKTQSIVKAADAAATIAGYLKIFIQDDGDQVADQSYYIPFYTLA